MAASSDTKGVLKIFRRAANKAKNFKIFTKRSSFEGFFASKGAAFAIPDGDFVRRASTHGGEMQIHLQNMVNLLRDEDTMRLAVKLESLNPKRMRYLTVVCSTGISDSEESIILGIDWIESCTIGFVLPVWRDTSIKLDGDGGFKVSSGGGRDYIFKPVSVQTMWTALQWINKATNWARAHNHFPSGLSHSWTSYYCNNINSEQCCLNEWNAMEDLFSDTHLTDFELVPKEQELFIKLIKHKMREILVSVDLDEITSREIRNRLEEETQMDLQGYKEMIDQVMLSILGQMDSSSKIFDYLYLGSEWNAANLEELKSNNVGYVLNITREIDNFFPGTFEYQNIRLWDIEESELLKYWDDTYKFINNAKNTGKSCLVHCRMGVSRSASTVMAYAMKEYGWTLSETMKYVKSKRACVQPNAGFWKQLITYEGILNSSKQRYNKLWRRGSLETELSGKPELKAQDDEELEMIENMSVTLADIERPLGTSTPTPDIKQDTPKANSHEDGKQSPQEMKHLETIEDLADVEDISVLDDSIEFDTCNVSMPSKLKRSNSGGSSSKTPLHKTLSAPVELGLPELRRSVTDLVESWGKEVSSSARISPEIARKSPEQVDNVASTVEDIPQQQEIVITADNEAIDTAEKQECVLDTESDPGVLSSDSIEGATECTTDQIQCKVVQVLENELQSPLSLEEKLEAENVVVERSSVDEPEPGVVKRHIQAITEKYQGNVTPKEIGLQRGRVQEEVELEVIQATRPLSCETPADSCSIKEEHEKEHEEDRLVQDIEYIESDKWGEDVVSKVGVVKMQKQALEELAKQSIPSKQSSVSRSKENIPAEMEVVSNIKNIQIGDVSPQEKRTRVQSEAEETRDETTTVGKPKCNSPSAEPAQKARKLDQYLIEERKLSFESEQSPSDTKKNDQVELQQLPRSDDEAGDIVNVVRLDLESLDLRREMFTHEDNSKESQEELLSNAGVVRRQKEALESRAKKINNSQIELKKERSLQNVDKIEVIDVLQRAKDIHVVSQENQTEEKEEQKTELEPVVVEEEMGKNTADVLIIVECLTDTESPKTSALKSVKEDLQVDLSTVEAGIVQRQKDALETKVRSSSLNDTETKKPSSIISAKEKTEGEIILKKDIENVTEYSKSEKSKTKRHTLIVQEIVQDAITDDESEENVLTESSPESIDQQKIVNDLTKSAVTEALQNAQQDLIEKPASKKLDEVLATKEEDWQSSNVKRKTLILEEVVRDFTTGSEKSAAEKEVARDFTTGSEKCAADKEVICVSTTGSEKSATDKEVIRDFTTGSEKSATDKEAIRDFTTVSEKSATDKEVICDFKTGSEKSATDKEVAVMTDNKKQSKVQIITEQSVRPQSVSSPVERHLQLDDVTEPLITATELEKTHKRWSSTSSLKEISGDEKVVKGLVEKFELRKTESMNINLQKSEPEDIFYSEGGTPPADEEKMRNFYIIGTKEWEDHELLKEKFDSRFR